MSEDVGGWGVMSDATCNDDEGVEGGCAEGGGAEGGRGCGPRGGRGCGMWGMGMWVGGAVMGMWEMVRGRCPSGEGVPDLGDAGDKKPGDAVSTDTAAVVKGEETHPHAHQHGGGGCQEGGPLCDGATIEVTDPECDMMLPESRMTGWDGDEEAPLRHQRTERGQEGAGMAECFLCGEEWCDCEGDGWGIGTPEGEEETEWGIGPPVRCGRQPGAAGPCGEGTLRKWGIGPPVGDGAEKRGIGPPGGVEAWEGHRALGDAVSMDTAAVENGEETHSHAHQHGGGLPGGWPPLRWCEYRGDQPHMRHDAA